jgi:hypothetical protein
VISSNVYLECTAAQDAGGGSNPACNTTDKKCGYDDFISNGMFVAEVEYGYVHTPRRWIVERTNSWLGQFRRLLVRHEHLPGRSTVRFAHARKVSLAIGVIITGPISVEIWRSHSQPGLAAFTS